MAPVSSLPCVLLPSKTRALSRVSMPSEEGIVPVICLSGCPASEPKSADAAFALNWRNYPTFI